MRAAKQEYRVTVTTQARDDLRRIYRFVADEMMLRQTAAQQQRRLRRELEMLRFSPARHITFNPLEIANNMKRQGGFVPGIRPGKPTSDFLAKILNYIIFIGAIGLIIVAVIPIFFNGVFGASVSFGGTSLIIVVGVVLETIKQVEAQLVNRHYKGFLND